MMNRLSKKFQYLLLFILISISTACNDDEPTEPDFAPPDSSFGLIYTHILAPSCGLNGCHNGTSRYPSLIGSGTYAAMVNPTVQNNSAASAGLHLVKPFSADSSFLYQKMIFDSSPFQFGSQMPQGGLTVDSNKIEFLRLWIEAGAPESGHVADRTLIE